MSSSRWRAPPVCFGQVVLAEEPGVGLRHDVLGRERFAGLERVAPGFLQVFLRAVFGLEPVAEARDEKLRVGGAGVEGLLGGVEEDVVLVLQLDEGERGILGVGQAGVRVLVLEQVATISIIRSCTSSAKLMKA